MFLLPASDVHQFELGGTEEATLLPRKSVLVGALAAVQVHHRCLEMVPEKVVQRLIPRTGLHRVEF